MRTLYIARLDLGNRVRVWACYDPATGREWRSKSWEQAHELATIVVSDMRLEEGEYQLTVDFDPIGVGQWIAAMASMAMIRPYLNIDTIPEA